jgi:protein-disulfide isomerase
MYKAMLPNLPASNENKAIRYSWKYGTSRSVSGTPTIFVNGVLFDRGEELSAQ